MKEFATINRVPTTTELWPTKFEISVELQREEKKEETEVFRKTDGGPGTHIWIF